MMLALRYKEPRSEIWIVDITQDFERAKTVYQQNFEQFRSLNQTMWQVPVIAMTLTGGLWFGAAKVGDMPGFQYLLLILAAIANLGLIVVLSRVRYVMGEYLNALKTFEPKAFVAADGKGLHASKAVARTFITLLICSGAISIFGTYLVYRSSADRPRTRRVVEVIDVSK